MTVLLGCRCENVAYLSWILNLTFICQPFVSFFCYYNKLTTENSGKQRISGAVTILDVEIHQ